MAALDVVTHDDLPHDLVGAERPRLWTPRPARLDSLGVDVIDVANALGLELYPHQELLADTWGLLREDGTLAHSRALLEIARQNGKTLLGIARVLTGLLAWGERKAVVAAQKLTLAVEILETAEQLLKDHLPGELVKLHRTNGRERLELANGAVWHARAANATAARGLDAVDMLWIDEVRDVAEVAWGALSYTQRAATGGQVHGVNLGPQALLTSNAGHADSHLHLRMRAQGLRTLPWDGTGVPPEITFASYSAPDGVELPTEPDDPYPWEAIAQANPALGRGRLTVRRLAAELADEPHDQLATEVLCVWLDALDSPWPPGAVAACADPGLQLEEGRPTWLAMDTTPDRSRTALVAGQQLEDGRIATRLLTTWEASRGAVDQLQVAGDVAERFRELDAQLVAYDRWTSGSVAAKLETAGIPVADCSGQEFAQACDELLDAMASQRWVHADQELANEHLADCAKKPAADGGWRIVRKHSAGHVNVACATAMVVHHAVQGALSTDFAFA